MPKIRVLIAKPGLDGHEAGAKFIARALRDAGMEIVYTGPRQTPESIVQSAFQEDVNVIGLSILSGSHKEFCQRLLELLRQNQAADLPVIVGGIIPREDIPALEKMGVRGVFGPGTKASSVSEFISGLIRQEA